ncbi:AmmeMemoRadiSam system protein B [Corynebacterium yudongzhengii]|nr:AmmeMemoRadiSam system protein B [Corynebacterium yudongzhengii]
MDTVRPPAVAGLFYPADPQQLRAEVSTLLAPHPPGDARIVVCPHAGYQFSGAVAARAVRELAPSLRKIAILSPNHRVPYRGMCTPGAQALATPLGKMRVWQPAEIASAPRVHRDEHGIEVILPFLQLTHPEAEIFPVVVAEDDAAAVAQLIDATLADPTAGVIISSDMSHSLEADAAVAHDDAALKRAEAFEPLVGNDACGQKAWNGLSVIAAREGLYPEVLARDHSGTASGDYSRVVGYAAVAYREIGAQLPEIARAAIAGDDVELEHPWLRADGAAFVTLTTNGKLRGCIGSVTAHRPLLEDVRINARNAAFRDPRFAPLDSLDGIDVEVSVLSTPVDRGRVSRDEALSLLEPGVGVTLSSQSGRGTFLPMVWQQLETPEEFLTQLMRKAGWRAWPDDARMETYTAREWR